MEKIPDRHQNIEKDTKDMLVLSPSIFNYLDHLIADIEACTLSVIEANSTDFSMEHSKEEIFAPLKKFVSQLSQRIEELEENLKKLKVVASQRIRLLLEKDGVNLQRIEIERSKSTEFRQHVRNLLDEIVKMRKERKKLLFQMTAYIKKARHQQNNNKLVNELSNLKKENNKLIVEKQHFEIKLKETEFEYKTKIEASEKEVRKITQQLKEQSLRHEQVIKNIKSASAKQLSLQKEMLIRQNKKKIQSLSEKYNTKVNQAQARFANNIQPVLKKIKTPPQFNPQGQSQAANIRSFQNPKSKENLRLNKKTMIIRDNQGFLYRVLKGVKSTFN